MPMLYHRKYNVRAIGNAELGGRAFHELPRQVMSLQAVSIRGEESQAHGSITVRQDCRSLGCPEEASTDRNISGQCSWRDEAGNEGRGSGAFNAICGFGGANGGAGEQHRVQGGGAGRSRGDWAATLATHEHAAPRRRARAL
jgi:hypothetical protein